MYALVDCNNFFVSCERVFNPALDKKPVIVLSSNDGCVIARSDEVKALGIAMGVPIFKVKDIVDAHQIHLYSSNFALYWDMSRRVVDILETFSPHMEVYSVDESFLFMDDLGTQESYTAWGQQIRDTIFQWIGIPTRVGFGPSKTLAKLANYWARKYKQSVYFIKDCPQELLKLTPVQEIWGIGRRISDTLVRHGVYTTFELMQMPDRWIRQTFNIMVLKTVHELRGTPCFELNEDPEPQENMMVSRSFGNRTDKHEDIKNYVSLFITRGAEKLRKRGLLTNYLGIHIRTSPHRLEPYYSKSITIPLDTSTNDTRILLEAALKGLKSIFEPGHFYKKAGVYFFTLQDKISEMPLLPSLSSNITAAPHLMEGLDRLNKKYGRNTVKMGSCGLTKDFGMEKIVRREKLSPHYTTSWDDLMKVN